MNNVGIGKIFLRTYQAIPYMKTIYKVDFNRIKNQFSFKAIMEKMNRQASD